MVSQRVFVGNLFQNYDVCLEELKSRFGKFGECSKDGFEKHNTFAYINMDFQQDTDFIKLKQSLNNVNFKGNTLKIDVAKPDWQTRWKLQHEQDLQQEPIVDKLNKGNEWRHYKKLEDINMSWKDRKEIIPGRYRKQPRSRFQLRNATFRVNVEGSLKVYKLYKNKLWGYERNRTAKDLAYQYVNGKWWNNYNHIIDRLDYSRSRQSIHGNLVDHKVNDVTSKTVTQDDNPYANEDIDLEDQMIEEEKSKNTNILDTFLGEMDFDKPLNVVDSDEAEAFGFSENEGREEEEREEEPYHTGKDNYYNNEDEKTSYNDNNENYKEESEEEFIPTFGVKPSTVEQTIEPVQGTVSNTETLRALFNPDTATDTIVTNDNNNNNNGGTFKLIQDDNEDIDQTKNVAEQIVDVEEESLPVIGTSLPLKTQIQNRLFFPHFDSPFLVGQTQLSQIETTSKDDIWSHWEDQFWENRGLWMKEMKNKKRDVIRQRKKRQSKDNNIIMI